MMRSTENFFSLFIQQLKDSLKLPLPAETAHRKMEASIATYLNLMPNEKTRKSAVLILFYPFKNAVYFPLILRSVYNGAHSGQVAFPGGRYELTDEDLIHTALREAHEEVGLLPGDVKILGTLTENFIALSNFTILPVVGYIPYRPEFIRNDREVAEIFEIPLDHFSALNAVGFSEIQIPGEKILTPHYEVKGHKVRGATAKMISEVLSLLR